MPAKTEITHELLADLKAKAEKATPGPWNLIGEKKTIVTGSSGRLVSSSTHCMLFRPHLLDQATGTDNASFIAAANPAVVLALIEHIEQLERGNERLKIELHDMDSSGREMHKDMQDLEREADWLAEHGIEMCPYLKAIDKKDEPRWCKAKITDEDKLIDCTGTRRMCWRRMAREAVNPSIPSIQGMYPES